MITITATCVGVYVSTLVMLALYAILPLPVRNRCCALSYEQLHPMPHIDYIGWGEAWKSAPWSAACIIQVMTCMQARHPWMSSAASTRHSGCNISGSHLKESLAVKHALTNRKMYETVNCPD